MSEFEAPRWARDVDRLLSRAAREVGLLASVTPLDAPKERARLSAAFSAGGEAQPRWVYPRADRREVAGLLDMADAILRGAPANDSSELRALYGQRIGELDLEVQIATHAGVGDIGAFARLRFGSATASDARAASALGLPARAGRLERGVTDRLAFGLAAVTVASLCPAALINSSMDSSM